MITDIGTYSTKQIFDRLRLVTKYDRSSDKPIFVFVQAKEHKWNVYNDKVYLFDKDNKIVNVSSCTTEAGTTLRRHKNPRGTWVYKTDEFYKDAYRYGLHNGRMEAMRQVVTFKGYRDKDDDMVADETGILYSEIANTNYHTITYDSLRTSRRVGTTIGSWSEGCCVANIVADYYKQIEFIKSTPLRMADMAILKEW